MSLYLTSFIQATNTPSVNTVPTSATLTAANNLLKTMHMGDTYAGMIERITQMQLNHNPQLSIIKPTIHAFFNKYMGWDALKHDMAQIYAEHYTTSELEEISTFYKTKIGQKTIKLMPILAAEGAKVGQDKLAAHMGELQLMIEAELKKMKLK